MKNTTTLRALRDLSLLCAASLTAASIWASGIDEDGYMLDAATWHTQVDGPRASDWPTDNWYRLVPKERAVEVRATSKLPGDELEPADSLYVRVPGTALKEGMRPTYRNLAAIPDPKVGKQYELTLGKTRFSFVVEAPQDDRGGVQYVINYGGGSYSYRLGQGEAQSQLQMVADLDGDAQPDFLVQVGDERFLLLSTRAQPGANRPAAEFWAVAW
jgi:hypothetical protein